MDLEISLFDQEYPPRAACARPSQIPQAQVHNHQDKLGNYEMSARCEGRCRAEK